MTSGGLLGGATVLKLDDLFACTPSDEGVARPRGCLCNTPAFARLNARLSSKFWRGGLDAAAGMFAAGVGEAGPAMSRTLVKPRMSVLSASAAATRLI